MSTFKEYFEGKVNLNEGTRWVENAFEEMRKDVLKRKERWVATRKQMQTGKFSLEGKNFDFDPKEQPEELERLNKMMDSLLKSFDDQIKQIDDTENKVKSLQNNKE